MLQENAYLVHNYLLAKSVPVQPKTSNMAKFHDFPYPQLRSWPYHGLEGLPAEALRVFALPWRLLTVHPGRRLAPQGASLRLA